MKKTLITTAALFTSIFAFAQNVGIGTTTPKARLHVADSAVVFTAPSNLPATPPPVEGSGVRMLWYPQFAAFRAGQVTGTQWDQINTGFGSFATGYNTTAEGTNSVAMGSSSEAHGFSSIAIGEQNIANGETVVSIGSYNNVTNDNSAAFGEYNTISGEHSLALGSGNTATGDYSSAIGYENTSTGAYSTAIGNNTKAKAVSGFSLGTYNDQTDAPTGTAAATDRLFQLGNGTATTKSNAITVLRNGNTGFGTVNPVQKIEINKGRIRFSGDIDINTVQGIEFTNAAGTTLNGFLGRYNDSMIGFYGFTGAGWKMLYNNTNGNLGLQGNANPRVPLSFSNSAGNKISIYDNGDGTHYGIGLQAAKMQFYTPSSSQDIVFGTGSSTSFTENVRIKGNGNVGLQGNASPAAPLSFSNATGNKISVYEDVNGKHYGIGFQTNKMQFITPTSSNDIVFGTGSSTSFTENMSVKGNGNVGINTATPSEKLEVVGNIIASGKVTASSIKITGGTPQFGEVLTAINTGGDAAWQAPVSVNTGFHATLSSTAGFFPDVMSLSALTPATVTLVDNKTSKDFDDGSKFNNTTNSYLVTISGVYQFNFGGHFSYPNTTAFTNTMVLRLMKNGTMVEEANAYFAPGLLFPNTEVSNSLTLKLLAGDVISLQAESADPTLFSKGTLSGFRVY